MIRGVHAMFYTAEAEALRTFLRDKLKLPFTDVGEGWLIFDVAEGDVGVHPTGDPQSPPTGTHNISFYCDDLEATVAELRGNGVEFSDGIVDRGYGLVTHFRMPGGVEVELYQPQYEKNRPAFGAKKSARKAVRRAVKRVQQKRAAKKAARGTKKTATRRTKRR